MYMLDVQDSGVNEWHPRGKKPCNPMLSSHGRWHSVWVPSNAVMPRSWGTSGPRLIKMACTMYSRKSLEKERSDDLIGQVPILRWQLLSLLVMDIGLSEIVIVGIPRAEEQDFFGTPATTLNASDYQNPYPSYTGTRSAHPRVSSVPQDLTSACSQSAPIFSTPCISSC
jgi:hypothetical protein